MCELKFDNVKSFSVIKNRNKNLSEVFKKFLPKQKQRKISWKKQKSIKCSPSQGKTFHAQK